MVLWNSHYFSFNQIFPIHFETVFICFEKILENKFLYYLSFRKTRDTWSISHMISILPTFFVFKLMSMRNKETLRKPFCKMNKNILLVLMHQNSFVAPTKYFAKSIKFWLIQQNFLLEQQQKFCCIHFVLSEYSLQSLCNEIICKYCRCIVW